MALPPIGNPRQRPFFPSNKPTFQEQEISTDYYFVDNQISSNKKDRDIKIKQLPPQVQDLIQGFLKEMVIVAHLLIELKKMPSPVIDKKVTSKEKDEYEKSRKNLEEFLQKIKANNTSFDDTYIIAEIGNPTSTPLDIDFCLEITTNCYLNRILYEKELEVFFEENKHQIAHYFCPAQLSKDNPISLLMIDMVSTETHHQGKCPAFITFKIGHNPAVKIVYKPRSAALDKAVIDTFAQINQLQPQYKSSEFDLPVYKMLDFENKSVWEYIEGKDITKERSAGIFLTANLTGNRLTKAQKYLDRMDSILTQMGISDLHRENVKIKNFQPEEKDVEIVPIDLENRQKGQPTQLGGRPKNISLTPQERQIIETFFEPKAQNVPCRYLPLSTHIMAGLIGDYRLCEQLISLLNKQFETDKFKILIKFQDFQKLILSSMLNRDVPYFTEFKDTLYYGLPSEGHIIGKKGG